MPFDADKFTAHLRKHAKARGAKLGDCARYVREALQAGGANTTGHPGNAKEYAPVLMRNGFHAITVENPDHFPFLKGDIVVMEPTKHGNQAGHIAAYDGKDWISDFVQPNGFWPGPAYSKEKPSYVVYRR